MTFDEIVTAARETAGDRDPAVYRYTTDEIAATIADVRRSLGVRKVSNLAAFTITLTEGSASIAPEPNDAQGLILATATALRLLEKTYRARVDAGTIGVSWTSGLEQESTISQEKAYSAMLDSLRSELAALILVDASKTFATRPQ